MQAWLTSGSQELKVIDDIEVSTIVLKQIQVPAKKRTQNGMKKYAGKSWRVGLNIMKGNGLLRNNLRQRQKQLDTMSAGGKVGNCPSEISL